MKKRQFVRFWALLLALSGSAGCGSDSDNGDKADGTGDEDLTQDQRGDSRGDVSDVTPGTAILERTAEIRFDCSVTRDTTNHRPKLWPQGGHCPVTTPAGTLLARTESTPPSPLEMAPTYFRVGPLGMDGTFGTDIELSAEAESVSGIGATPLGDGFLLAWADGAIYTSLRDQVGAEVTAPQKVDSSQTDYRTQPVLAPLGEQVGMVVAVPSASGHEGRFLRLDPQGARLGNVVKFATVGEQWSHLAPSVAAGVDRWGVVWQEDDRSKGAVYFTALDEQGQVVAAKRRVSPAPVDGVRTTPNSFARARTTIQATEGGWLVAWSEVREGVDYSSGASSIIQLARLDADGNVQELAPVRNIVVDTDEVEPLLVPFQGVVGLFWSSGDHIYMCGGCWPNHRVDFVLLDPDTLVPISEVQTLSPTPNGLLDLAVTVDGDQILVTAEIGYHVYDEPASAALSCTKK